MFYKQEHNVLLMQTNLEKYFVKYLMRKTLFETCKKFFRLKNLNSLFGDSNKSFCFKTMVQLISFFYLLVSIFKKTKKVYFLINRNIYLNIEIKV